MDSKKDEIIRLQSGIIDELFMNLAALLGTEAAELPCVADMERAARLIRELEAEP